MPQVQLCLNLGNFLLRTLKHGDPMQGIPRGCAQPIARARGWGNQAIEGRGIMWGAPWQVEVTSGALFRDAVRGLRTENGDGVKVDDDPMISGASWEGYKAQSVRSGRCSSRTATRLDGEGWRATRLINIRSRYLIFSATSAGIPSSVAVCIDHDGHCRGGYSNQEG